MSGPAWDQVDTIHPSCLNPRHEIRLPWNPEFDAWHEHWFDVTLYPRVRLDQMSLLEEFLTEDNYAIVPLLVAKNLHQGQMHICRLTDGPEDEIIYYLTRSNLSLRDPLLFADSSVNPSSTPASSPFEAQNKSALIRHFLQLLRTELMKWDVVHSFL